MHMRLTLSWELPNLLKFSALDFAKFSCILVICVLSGCATQYQQIKMNESNEQFKSGDLQGTANAIESAFKDKNTLYYMEIGGVQRLQGSTQIPSSTKNLRIADQQVDQWEIDAQEKLKRSFFNTSAYLLSEGFSSNYDPKPYEITLLSQTLALNHLSQGNWSDAMVEAKKMGQREKVIEQLIQSKVSAVTQAQQDQHSNPQMQGATNRIQEISGYPVNLLDDPETRALKNSYQNPAAYYLSGFIHESQGEASLAAPGYRLAIELRPSVNFFKTSMAKLDSNIANQGKKSFADTLIIIDTGYLPKIIPQQISQSFPIGGSRKLVTLTFPVIEQSTERFTPTQVQIGDKVANLELAANIEAMARKNLSDEMPAYVLRATSRALTSLAAQYAADRAAQQAASRNNHNDQNNGSAALIGMIASMITGYSLQAINVTDVRHWSTLPAQTYMARMGLPIGPNILKFTMPSGAIQSQAINLVGGYNVVYIRMFRNKASVLVSNDPTALPVKTAPNPTITPTSNPLKEGASNTKPTFVQTPLRTTPVEFSPSPASSNMEGVKPYEPPSLFNSFQHLFN